MYPEPMFTRREGDNLTRRIDAIDQHGTRGMELLANQTRDNAQAIGRLQQEMTARFQEHTNQHERELSAIRRRRQFGLTTIVAIWVAVIATITLLIDIATQVAKLH